jgi:hypothetical protein
VFCRVPEHEVVPFIEVSALAREQVSAPPAAFRALDNRSIVVFAVWPPSLYGHARAAAVRRYGDLDQERRDSVRELLGVRMDPLARKFHETHDMTVKDEIERLLKQYGKLKEPWVFVSR